MLRRYAEYKDSGVPWIGEIPKEWNIVKLKRLCRIKRGASPRPIDDPIYFDEEGKRYWVRISDVTRSTKYLTECEQRLSPLGIENSVKIGVGDLFISICASVGKPCISQVEACIHDGFVLLDRLPAEYKNYIYYIFELETPCLGLGKIGTQLNLNSETIGNIEIPLHDTIGLIAAYLDRRTAEVDNLIVDHQRLIELLEFRKRQIIANAVTHGLDKTVLCQDSGIEYIGAIPKTWELLPLFSVAKENNIRNDKMTCNNLLSLSYGKIVPKDIDTNFGLLPTNFEGYQIVNAGYTVLRLTDLQNDKRSLRTGYVEETGIITSAYMGLIPGERLDSKYFNYLLYAYDLLKVYYALGSGLRQTLNFSDMKRLPVLIPPLPEQKEIVAYINGKTAEIDVLITDITEQISNLEKYRKIIINDAVTGKIKVTEG